VIGGGNRKRNGKRKPPRRQFSNIDHVRADGTAKRRMSQHSAQHLATVTGMNAYRCSGCGAWHVGRPAASTLTPAAKFHAPRIHERPETS
jgi:hypothetical protein